jgi:hypothetical protein
VLIFFKKPSQPQKSLFQFSEYLMMSRDLVECARRGLVYGSLVAGLLACGTSTDDETTKSNNTGIQQTSGTPISWSITVTKSPQEIFQANYTTELETKVQPTYEVEKPPELPPNPCDAFAEDYVCQPERDNITCLDEIILQEEENYHGWSVFPIADQILLIKRGYDKISGIFYDENLAPTDILPEVDFGNLGLPGFGTSYHFNVSGVNTSLLFSGSSLLPGGVKHAVVAYNLETGYSQVIDTPKPVGVFGLEDEIHIITSNTTLPLGSPWPLDLILTIKSYLKDGEEFLENGQRELTICRDCTRTQVQAIQMTEETLAVARTEHFGAELKFYDNDLILQEERNLPSTLRGYLTKVTLIPMLDGRFAIVWDRAPGQFGYLTSESSSCAASTLHYAGQSFSASGKNGFSVLTKGTVYAPDESHKHSLFRFDLYGNPLGMEVHSESAVNERLTLYQVGSNYVLVNSSHLQTVAKLWEN